MTQPKNNTTITETETKGRKHQVFAWLNPDILKKLQKTATTNPTFDCLITEKEWHDDGDLVKVQFVFTNCGKIQFHERLIQLLVTALTK